MNSDFVYTESYDIRQKITLVLNDKKNVALISTVRLFKYAYVVHHLQNENLHV